MDSDRCARSLLDVRIVCLTASFYRHQLETPGRYSQLQALYVDQRWELDKLIAVPINSSLSTSSCQNLPHMKVCLFALLMTYDNISFVIFTNIVCSAEKLSLVIGIRYWLM